MTAVKATLTAVGVLLLIAAGHGMVMYRVGYRRCLADVGRGAVVRVAGRHRGGAR